MADITVRVEDQQIIVQPFGAEALVPLLEAGTAAKEGAEAAAELAGQYANADTDADISGAAPGERGAKYWSNLTATQATTQIAAITAEGAAQIEDVQAEGSIQVGIVGAAGAAVSLIASSYASALSTGANTLLYESNGTTNQATLSNNRGVFQTCLVNGTHITTGQTIQAIRWRWACASTTATVEIKVWKRNVSGATAAGTLNNAAPIATHDTLVATYTTTPTAIGITAGTTNPALTSILTLASSFTVEAGYDYMFQFRNLDNTSTVVNCGWTYYSTSAGAGTQRRGGFEALTATPTTFNPLTFSNRIPSITVYGPTQKTLLPATDATLRTLIDQRDQEVAARMNARNTDNLYINANLFPQTLSVPVSFWGDSLTFDAIGSPLYPGTGYKATELVDTVTSGTVNNYGINGQTSTQITTRVLAGSGTDLAGFNRVLMGTNDVGDVAKTAALILADYATCAATFTNSNYVFSSPWSSEVVSKLYDVRKGLVTTYGAKAIDMHAFWARHAATAADASSSLSGNPPSGLLGLTMHQNREGGIVKGVLWSHALIAQNGGAPFVHDGMFGFKSGDASGAAIGTVRTLGTALNFNILAGNDDGAVQIDRGTGAITRTAKSLIQPYREVYVEAENNKGKGRNGKVILVQQMDGTSPQKAVTLVGNGASIAHLPESYAPAAGKELTIVACLKLDLTKTNGQLLGTGGTAGVRQNGSNMSFIALDSGGSTIGTVTMGSESPSDWHFYFWTIKADTGVMAGVVDEGTAVTATPTNTNLAIANLNTLFSNTSLTLPFYGSIKMMAVYNAYYDITSSSVRANWYDSVTRLPKDIGASGTAGGALATPLIYVRGMAGDYLMGKNYGSGGDMHVPYPIGRQWLGFLDEA